MALSDVCVSVCVVGWSVCHQTGSVQTDRSDVTGCRDVIQSTLYVDAARQSICFRSVRDVIVRCVAAAAERWRSADWDDDDDDCGNVLDSGR